MQVKKQWLEPDMEKQTGSKLGKEYIKAVYIHPAYFGLDEAQTRIKMVGRNINNLRYGDDIFLNSQITADGDCSHEIQRHLLLGRKAMTNLDSILKSRDITLPNKVHLVKAMVFPVIILDVRVGL